MVLHKLLLLGGIIPTFAYQINPLHHICLWEVSHAWGHDGFPLAISQLINISLSLDPTKSRYGRLSSHSLDSFSYRPLW